MAQIQCSVRQPFGDEHHQNGDQAIELHQPPRQGMQLTLLGWIRPFTHRRTEGSLLPHDRTNRKRARGLVVRLPKVLLWVGGSPATASELAALD